MPKSKEQKIWIVSKQSHYCETEAEDFEGGYVIIFDNEKAAKDYAKRFGYIVDEDVVRSN